MCFSINSNGNPLLSFLGEARSALSSDTVACSRLCRLRNKQTRLSESSRDRIHFLGFIEFYAPIVLYTVQLLLFLDSLSYAFRGNAKYTLFAGLPIYFLLFTAQISCK